jgi:hypothetical protein
MALHSKLLLRHGWLSKQIPASFFLKGCCALVLAEHVGEELVPADVAVAVGVDAHEQMLQRFGAKVQHRPNGSYELAVRLHG